MAPNLRSNGPGHNSGTPEKPYFDRLVAIETHIKQLRQDRKEVCIEAKDADVPIGPLKLAVKLHLESGEARLAREEKEAEAARILRAMGPLGEAAVEREEQSRRRRRRSKAEIDKEAHIYGPSRKPFEAEIDNPALAGRNAAVQGMTESSNPFNLGTAESTQWIVGYKNEMDMRAGATGAASSPYEDEDHPPAA